MTDPLGQSQVLPYLAGLSKKGYEITLLSCEKKQRYAQTKGIIEKITKEHNIDWRPIFFTTSPPVLAKYYDLYQLKRKAEVLHKEKLFSLVHCRSYVSAAVGLYLKKKYQIKLLFDMRGFWVDERVDGGAWNLKNPLFKFAYRQYKIKEAEYIANSDAIISLTEAGKKEIQTWDSYQQARIQVIPCSADFQHFSLSTPSIKAQARNMLGLHEGALVISYLGSVGAWYMLEEMLELLALIKHNYPKAVFLFVTPEPASLILQHAEKHGFSSKDFVIKSASRAEVPLFIAASDVNLFFIKQSYSKIASSPTKLGEILAMGIPVICNSKVGDVEQIVNDTNSGVVINSFDKESYKRVVAAIPSLLTKAPETIRANAFEYYTLDNAIEKYAEVYSELLS
ncbi:glycosyltransferase [Nibribacter ruber]|uniref:Glycosyltransferase n=1 Tax=Nibribacter ruber TaxID=2698458 RepID=A0A6P1P3S8_9BACT|nr:glycosyltransferase [Nibribacter ruber]QHL89052.1 glycosyltransferase [Nibribacter ruber]